jgi:hypothetical protein
LDKDKTSYKHTEQKKKKNVYSVKMCCGVKENLFQHIMQVPYNSTACSKGAVLQLVHRSISSMKTQKFASICYFYQPFSAGNPN